MTSLLRPRRIVTVASLVLVWCALWGEITAANLAAGVAIGIGITALDVGTPGSGGIRPLPLMHMLWIVGVDLVKSTVGVATEVITPTDRTDESIVAVTVPKESRDHLLLLIVAITLTPGTAVVDADADTGILYLHLLHNDRRVATIEHVEQLARLACEGLPTNRTRTP